MGKRIAKKKTIVRSSSIEKTVEEGKEFVQQSTRIIKKREKEQEKIKALQESRAAQQAAKAARRIKPAPARRVAKKPKNARGAARPAAVRVAPVLVAAPVVRTGSRASNAGVIRTSSKNSQVIEQ